MIILIYSSGVQASPRVDMYLSQKDSLAQQREKIFAINLEIGEAHGGCSGDQGMLGIGFSVVPTIAALSTSISDVAFRGKLSFGMYFLLIEIGGKLSFFHSLYVSSGCHIGWNGSRGMYEGGNTHLERVTKSFIEDVFIGAGLESRNVFLEAQVQFLPGKATCNYNSFFSRPESSSIQETGNGNFIVLFGIKL